MGYLPIILFTWYYYCLLPFTHWFVDLPCTSCSQHRELYMQEPQQTLRPWQAWSLAVLSDRRNVSFPWDRHMAEMVENDSAPPATSHRLSHSNLGMFLKHHNLGVDTCLDHDSGSHASSGRQQLVKLWQRDHFQFCDYIHNIIWDFKGALGNQHLPLLYCGLCMSPSLGVSVIILRRK